MTRQDQGLVLDDIDIRLNGRGLLSLARLVVAPGEIVTVMGESGAGKSTLLAFVSGMVAPVFRASGKVWLKGRRIDGLPPEARRTGLLFQDDLLFPHLTVGGNLGFALPSHLRGQARKQVIAEALRHAGLEGFAARDPASLSGGQRARVAVMRVLLSGPDALLLDEPFSKLDQTLRASFREFVFAQARGRGLPVLLVSHDAADAAAAAGPVVRLGER